MSQKCVGIKMFFTEKQIGVNYVARTKRIVSSGKERREKAIEVKVERKKSFRQLEQENR